MSTLATTACVDGPAGEGYAPRSDRFLSHDDACPPPPWLTRVFEQLLALRELEADWDTYGARPIAVDALMGRIAQLLQGACEIQPRLRAPQIVPTPEGGIQLEWHDRRVDLEIEFRPDGDIEVLVECDGGEWEGSLLDDPGLIDRLARALRQLG